MLSQNNDNAKSVNIRRRINLEYYLNVGFLFSRSATLQFLFLDFVIHGPWIEISFH